ncbi:hypothetical protein GP486_004160 [Trichoglossum hirsutum]|uniref:Uncharacterized protein n=1 Tax=Trichoglossum hirsutum TaxID=265104 RepID=A0A9P8RQ49_9PEZI|nr:hypothetical protein GP486_004160 [Trichoglossum hirsutum]
MDGTFDVDRAFLRSSSDPLLPQQEQDLLVMAQPGYSNMPPPSIISSVQPTSPTAGPYSTRLTPFLALGRKEKQLQRDLQTLLDAQGEGLLAGLEGHGRGDGSSEGSSTPTATSMGASKVVPIRQPTRKRIGLRAARKGILTAIHEFAAVKESEKELLDADLQSKEEALRQVEAWEKKRQGLGEKINAIKSGDEERRVGELKDEAKRVQSEIEDLESRLLELQVKHRTLTSEASEVENAVQSKLSSYKASLSILDSQVSRFLARPPFARSPASRSSDEVDFLSLQPRRRTLEMAGDYLRAAQNDLNHQRAAAETERDALEDGAVVWEDIINEVTAFERKLRAEMRALRNSRTPGTTTPGRQRTTSSSFNSSGQQPHDATEGMQGILRAMDEAILQLESKFKLAEARDWKLLVCCIGAELEAFREGRGILEDALRATMAAPLDARRGDMTMMMMEMDHGAATAAATTNLDLDHVHPGDPLGAVNHGLVELQDDPPGRVERSESEDEGPDPTLLFSYQDTY